MNRCVNSEYLTVNRDKPQMAFIDLAIQGTRESAL